MRTAALIALLLTLRTETFWASQYAPGVMERVVEYRIRNHSLPDSTVEPVGYIAVIDCAEIGNVWWLRPADSSLLFMPFQVADCSGHAATTAWMQRNNIQVELEYKWAVAFGTVGHGLLMERCYGTYCNLYRGRHTYPNAHQVVEPHSRWTHIAD